jgi:mannosyltransferase
VTSTNARRAVASGDTATWRGTSGAPALRRARGSWMRYRTAVSSVAAGILAFVVSWIGSWVPSFWGDEAASIMSAHRPWSSLLDELGRVDAVHGTYYALLHVWIDFFGASQFSTRLPSAMAVGLAAAGVVVLVARYGRLRLGILSALVFAVLPRTTYMGTEVRSYALSTAFAVWLAVLFLRLVTRRMTRVLPWAGFAVGFAACIYVFLYLALLALPFAAVLLWEARGRMASTAKALLRPSTAATPDVAALRATIVRWMLATLGGIVLTAPLLVFALKERGQIKFLGKHPGVDFFSFTVTQWFDYSWGVAILAWGAVVALAVVGLLAWRRRRASGVRRMLRTDRARLVLFAVAWLALPPVALLILNAFVPAYTVRYMSFTTPAFAILIALAIELAARWVVSRSRAAGDAQRWGTATVASIVGVALVAGVAAPTYVAQRGPYAKNGGSDWAEVSSVVQQHAHPGDDIVFDETTRPSRRPRLAMHLYPEQFADVVDVTLAIPYENRDSLWDKTYPIPEVAGRIEAGNGRVWLVEYRGPDKEGVVSSTGMRERMSDLRALGFTLAKSYPLHRDVVYLFTRGAAS